MSTFDYTPSYRKLSPPLSSLRKNQEEKQYTNFTTDRTYKNKHHNGLTNRSTNDSYCSAPKSRVFISKIYPCLFEEKTSRHFEEDPYLTPERIKDQKSFKASPIGILPSYTPCELQEPEKIISTILDQ